MTNRTKSRPVQHQIDTQAESLLRSQLPAHWVVRNYRPDYGLDLAVELFKSSPTPSDPDMAETLGEHVFVQLKGKSSVRRKSITVRQRNNVERSSHLGNPTARKEIEVIPVVVDTIELQTIQRMGSGVPVLLVIVDLANEHCYFVCLNDYIDKILIPIHEDFTSTSSRSIYVPTRNEIDSRELGHSPFEWYGKRAKLYAAFQKFHYQYGEIRYARGTAEFDGLTSHFAKILDLYDFWEDVGKQWWIVGRYYLALKGFLAGDGPGLWEVNKQGVSDWAKFRGMDEQELLVELQEATREEEIAALWNGLEIIPRNYEEICREWYLPTYLGAILSYP